MVKIEAFYYQELLIDFLNSINPDDIISVLLVGTYYNVIYRDEANNESSIPGNTL